MATTTPPDLSRPARAHGNLALRQKMDTVDWARSVPFLALQLSPLAVFWVGWSPVAVLAAVLLYGVRMFAITAFYHRYFSHRSFRTSRGFQFLFAVLGNSSGQKGPLWWAGHHRFHHRHADTDADLHSPARHGFWWSHIGWLISDLSRPTRVDLVRDLARIPELRFLDRHYHLVPLALVGGLYGLGRVLESRAPGLGTSGGQMLVWGFFVSTVALFHGTYLINSLAHRWGRRRYATRDESRNNALLSAITLGEGWHNNHHRCPSAARHGFRRGELDPTWLGLKVLERLRVVRDLRPVPPDVLAGGEGGR